MLNENKIENIQSKIVSSKENDESGERVRMCAHQENYNICEKPFRLFVVCVVKIKNRNI